MDEPAIFVKKDEFFLPLLAVFPRFSPLMTGYTRVRMLLHFVATRIVNEGQSGLRFNRGRIAFSLCQTLTDQQHHQNEVRP
jgi:hypothetical protein